VGPLRARTLAPWILPLLEAPTEAYFGIFRSSVVVFDFMSSTVAKRVPLRPIFRVGNSQKSLESEIRRVGWLGYERNGFFGEEFATMEDIKSNVTAELRKIPKEAFRRCFQQWQDRWSKCVCVCVYVCVRRSYFEGY
jgi:hypothetical protein